MIRHYSDSFKAASRGISLLKYLQTFQPKSFKTRMSFHVIVWCFGFDCAKFQISKWNFPKNAIQEQEGKYSLRNRGKINKHFILVNYTYHDLSIHPENIRKESLVKIHWLEVVPVSIPNIGNCWKTSFYYFWAISPACSFPLTHVELGECHQKIKLQWIFCPIFVFVFSHWPFIHNCYMS